MGSPAPVLLTNKTKLLHLIELKDYRVKAGRRKCARGYACPGFAGRRVPFGKSLNGWPDPHIGSPLSTPTMQQGERHRVQSVLAPRVGCRLGVSVAAHPSAATCSYNSLLLSLRSLTSETLNRFASHQGQGTCKHLKPANRKKLSSSKDLIFLKRRSEADSGRERTPTLLGSLPH